MANTCKAVFWPAWKDTRAFFGWNRKIISWPILFGIGLLIYWNWRGEEAVSEEIAVFVAFGLVPVVLFATAVFFWNVVKVYHYRQFQKLITSTGLKSVEENNVLIKLVEKKRNYQFYINREDLKRVKPNLADELKGMQKVWAAWHTGGSVLDNDDLLDPDFKPKEFKLILTDPNDDYMIGKMETRGSDSTFWKHQIQHTADHAHQKGCVYFYAGPIGDSLLIADPKKSKGDKFSQKAWARVDTTVPYGANLRRSSYMIVKSEAPKQFAALVEHFKILLGTKDRITEYKGEYNHWSPS